MKTKEELEILINESALFSIDSSIDAELFVATERAFLKDLAELMSYTRNDFPEIGYEIIKTAKACIKSYRPEGGVFLHYFNVALKKTLFASRAKERAAEIRGGMTLDEKTERTIRQILKLTKARGEDVYNSYFQEKIANMLGILPSMVYEIIAINDNATVQFGNTIIQSEGGEETELFSFIASKIATPEDNLVKFDTVREIIFLIDEMFLRQQERIKPLLSKLLTARIINALEEQQFIEEAVQGIECFDEEVFESYISSGKVPMARDIAKTFGVHEASASRTLRNFIEKINRKQ